MKHRIAYQKIRFCPWCGKCLIMVSTSIEDVKSCPAFLSHTISLNARIDLENDQVLILDASRIPDEDLG